MIRLLIKLFYTGIILIEGLIGIRFILNLINANKKNEIVATVFEYSEPFVKPFYGITDSTFTLFGIVFDLNSLVALVFFMVIGYIAIELIKAFSRD